MTDQNRIAELERQVTQLQHRLSGHQQAIARWRQRAGVDPPCEDLELYKTEIYAYHDEWFCREYYTMPIERSPELLAEAWAWVIEHGLIAETERVHLDQYDKKRGWVLMLSKPWPI